MSWKPAISLLSAALAVAVAGFVLLGPDRGPDGSRPAVEEPEPEATPLRTSRVHAVPGLPRIAASTLRPPMEGPPPSEDPALVDGPLALLPPDTVAVALTPSWSEVVDELGLFELLQRHAGKVASVEDGLAEVGLQLRDFLDPSGLGIDPHGSVVLAWLDVRSPVAVFGASLTDPALFEQALYLIEGAAEAAGPGLRTEEMGDAMVTIEATELPKVAVVRRGGQVYLLVATGWLASVETAVAQLVWQDPNDALPLTETWRRTMAPIRGKQGFGFVNLPAIHAQTRMILEDELARKEGAYPEEERPKYVNRQMDEIRGASQLSEGILGGMQGLGAGVFLANGRVELDARLALGAGTLADRLLRNRPGLSHLQRALTSEPVFVLDGAMNAAALQELIRLFSSAVGADLDQALAVFKGFSGIEGNPLDLLSGEAGIAMFAPSADDPQWGLVLTLGVTDADVAADIVDRVATLGSLAGGVTTDPDIGGIAFDVPGWRKLYVAQADGAVIATSDLSALDRLRSGGGSLATLMERQELGPLVGSGGDAGALLWNFSALESSFEAPSREYYAPPPNPEGTQALTEAVALGERIAEVDFKADVALAEQRRTLVGLLGTLAAAGRYEGQAIAIRGGWYFETPTARDLVAAIVDSAVALDDIRSRRDLELSELYARQADIAAKNMNKRLESTESAPEPPEMLRRR